MSAIDETIQLVDELQEMNKEEISLAEQLIKNNNDIKLLILEMTQQLELALKVFEKTLEV